MAVIRITERVTYDVITYVEAETWNEAMAKMENEHHIGRIHIELERTDMRLMKMVPETKE